MKKLIYAAVAAAVIAIAYVFCFSGTRGKGEIISKRFALTAPSRIQTISVSDDITLIITDEAPFGSVRVSTYENIMEMVSVNVDRDGRSANISLLEGMKVCGDAKLVAYMRPITSVRFYNATSGATIRIENSRRVSNCDVTLSDGAKFEGYNLSTNDIRVNLSGRSEMEISTSGVARINGIIEKSTIRHKGVEIQPQNIHAEQKKGAKIEFVKEYTVVETPAEEVQESEEATAEQKK